MLPAGFSLPEGRVKPWGTGHALLCARELVRGPFVVINADDYYGPEAYRTMYQYLAQPREKGEYAMVGYPVEHTLTDHGEVTRGVCVRDSRGYLKEVVETRGLYRKGSGGAYKQDGAEMVLPAGTTISMNFWGFDTGLFEELAAGFPRYLESALRDDPLKCEYLLPGAVEEMLQAGKASVQVLPTRDTWFGVTYKEDKPIVKAAIRARKEKGVYPQNLWGG